MSRFNRTLWDGGVWNGLGAQSFVIPAQVVGNAPPPQQLTNVATLINGGYSEAGLMLYRNGVLLTQGVDYTRNGGIVTMLMPPQAGDTMTARVFVIGKALGGPTRERYIAPWTMTLAGDYNGTGTLYKVEFGPTITGPCNGRNNTFHWQVSMDAVKIYRNGVLQTGDVDVSAGQYKAMFLPGAEPQDGDLLTILGYSAGR